MENSNVINCKNMFLDEKTQCAEGQIHGSCGKPRICCPCRPVNEKACCENCGCSDAFPEENQTASRNLPLNISHNLNDYSYNTVISSYQAVLPFNSDGATIDMGSHQIPYIDFPETLILDINTTFHTELLHEAGTRQFNVFRCFFALFEAPAGTQIFTIIPESKIDYGTVSIPPYSAKEFHKSATGLSIRTSADKQYIFAAHYSCKNQIDWTKFGYYFHISGNFSYTTA